MESAQRTTEGFYARIFQPSAARTEQAHSLRIPTDKSVGYSHIVREADDELSANPIIDTKRRFVLYRVTICDGWTLRLL